MWPKVVVKFHLVKPEQDSDLYASLRRKYFSTWSQHSLFTDKMPSDGGNKRVLYKNDSRVIKRLEILDRS